MKKTLLIILGLTLCLLSCGCTGSAATAAAPHSGSIQVRVCDGFTDEPLAGAQVVIPEWNLTYITDRSGSTGSIDIPISADSHFSGFYPAAWGECTLLVYYEGYIPYALFHVAVWEQQARQGPNIYLFPEDPENSGQPFIVVEAPPRLWVNGLLEKFPAQRMTSSR